MLRDAVTDLRGLMARLDSRAVTLDADLSAQQAEFFTRLRTERTGAIEDAFGRLAAERRAVFDDIEARQGQVEPTLASLREALQATTRLTTELTGSLQALDRVVAHFDREPGDPTPPLEVEDLTAAAVAATQAAERLTQLIEHTHRLIGSDDTGAGIERLDRATRGLVDHVFWRLAGLLLLLPAGLAALRWLPRRRD